MDMNAVGWFEIYVNDMERAKAFYQSVFQKGDFMDLSSPEAEMFAFPWVENAGGAAGALVKSDFNKPSGQGTIIYFNCDDCAVEEKRAGENGGSIVQAKMSIGEYGFISIIQDTEGNTIGLHSQK